MGLSVDEVMAELEALGDAGTRRIYANHGAPPAQFGVKVGDLKGVLKRTKKDHELALALWETGNSDARYLAGLMADERRMTAADLQRWAESASWYMLAEYSVAWLAAESGLAAELAPRWIDDPREMVAAAGWSALSSHVAMVDDAALDLDALAALLDRAAREIHGERNRVRYAMNGFVIAVGSYVAPLAARADAAAEAIGAVRVDMGGTACKVPRATEYIAKVRARGPARKRRSVRC